jgi:5-formyltetrahydrofolate cyclo-ligase
MRKEALRQQIRQRKQQYTTQQLTEFSLSVIDRLKPRLAEARTVLAYYSLPDEVCTHQLLDDLLAAGKTVILPRVLDAGRMELRRYKGPQDLKEGAFHIMEPVGEPFTDYHLIDVALIPGVAFDAKGHRLGRGRGYYDRFLSSHLSLLNSHLLIGVCFDFQKVDVVPFEANDISVDMVI